MQKSTGWTFCMKRTEIGEKATCEWELHRGKRKRKRQEFQKSNGKSEHRLALDDASNLLMSLDVVMEYAMWEIIFIPRRCSLTSLKVNSLVYNWLWRHLGTITLTYTCRYTHINQHLTINTKVNNFRYRMENMDVLYHALKFSVCLENFMIKIFDIINNTLIFNLLTLILDIYSVLSTYIKYMNFISSVFKTKNITLWLKVITK